MDGTLGMATAVGAALIAWAALAQAHPSTAPGATVSARAPSAAARSSTSPTPGVLRPAGPAERRLAAL